MEDGKRSDAKSIPVEVWMAAKAHRKTNFFGAAALGCEGTTSVLFSVLKHGDVAAAVVVGLTSKNFAKALFSTVSSPTSEDNLATSIWCLLGGNGGDVIVSLKAVPFASDLAFNIAAWARHRVFTARVSCGMARPAAVVPGLLELGTGFVELGPFLPTASDKLRGGPESAEATLLSKLVVADGLQSFRVVDVARRRTELVPIDRFGSQAWHSSSGVHPAVVTGSLPLQPRRHCSTAGGMLTVSSDTSKMTSGAKDRSGYEAGGGYVSSASKESDLVFQWLQLPEFEASVIASDVAPSETPPPSLTRLSSRLSVDSGCSAKGGKSPKAKGGGTPQALMALRSLGSTSPQASPKRKPSFGSPKISAACSPKSALSQGGSRTSPTISTASSPKARGTPASPPFFPASPSSTPNAASFPSSPALHSLLRCSVHQDKFIAAMADSAPAGNGTTQPVTFEVDAVWPLPMQRALLLVRDVPVSIAASATSPKADSRPAGEHWWLQVWEMVDVGAYATESLDDFRLDDFSLDGSKPPLTSEPELLASTLINSPLASMDVGSGELLCGFRNGSVELRALPGRRGDGCDKSIDCLEVKRTFSAEAACTAALHVLLRNSGKASEETTAVVAFSERVSVYASSGGSSCAASTLPVPGFALAHIHSLKAVGSSGFAVCSDQHVYAFECGAGSITTIIAVVALPDKPLSLSFFDANPYEFVVSFAIGDENQERHNNRNTFCCLWPSSLGKVQLPSEPTADQSRYSCDLDLDCWIRGSAGSLCKASVDAVCLNDALSVEHRKVPISALALHSATSAGTPSRHGLGLGLLAVAANGLGVGVFQWGVETSPEITQLREQYHESIREQEKQRKLDDLQRQLLRLQQKLKDIDRLKKVMEVAEARAATLEEGEEQPAPLTAEQVEKVGKRDDVVTAITTICQKLKIDPGKAMYQCYNNGKDDIDPALLKQQQILQRKREKIKLDDQRNATKRNMQQERGGKREQKGCGED